MSLKRRTPSSKKKSAKRELGEEEFEMAMRLQKMIKDNEKREKDKVYQQQINNALKKIKEKEKKKFDQEK